MLNRIDARRILLNLRSGNPFCVSDAELELARAAGFSTAGCSCPNFPRERSRHCYAHSYLAPRLDETAFSAYANAQGVSVEQAPGRRAARRWRAPK